MKKIICLLMCFILVFGTSSTIIFAKDGIIYTQVKPAKMVDEVSSADISDNVYDVVRILVAFNENAEQSAKDVKNALSYEQLMQNIYLFVFEGDYASIAYENFKNDPNVKSVSFDAYVGIDPLEEEYLVNATKNYDVEIASVEGNSKPNDYNAYPSQWYLDDIGVYDAWQVMEENFPKAKDNSVVVAVIDSGIDTSSPDLKDAILTDENGDYIGFNTLTDSTNFEDDNTNTYHGTAVSSFIAAKANNGYGICGVAGNYNVKILPIKALNSSGKCYTSSIIKAVGLAIDNNADIINMSLSYSAPIFSPIETEDGDKVIVEILQYAINVATQNGICVVAAAGNYYSNYPLFPASYVNVLSVAAYNQTRERAAFSQYNDYIDISAPGKGMAHINKEADNCVNKDGAGTSYSAPLVSATAALLKLAYPEITPQEISNIIKTSATDLGKEGYDQFYGHGALDVENAVKSLANLSYRPTTKITIPESVNVKVGEHKQIEVNLLPVYASNKKVRYESMDTSIATVSNNGVVYGVGIGAVDIAVIPDDTEEVYYTTVYVEAYSTAENDGEYSRQTGTPLSEIKITGDEFLFYADGYLWHGEKDLINSSAIIKPTKQVSNEYKFCEVLTKNKDNKNSADFSYFILNGSTGIFTFSNSPYFPKNSKSFKDAQKTDDEKYIDLAHNNKNIAILTDSGRIGLFQSPTAESTNYSFLPFMPYFEDNNVKYPFYLDNISYVYDEACQFFVGTGKIENGNSYILLSDTAYDYWKSVAFFQTNTNNDKVKDILIDGKNIYLLTDNALYHFKVARGYYEEDEKEGPALSKTPKKILDINASDIKELIFINQDDKTVLAGVKNDNSLCVIANDGSVLDVNTDMENVTHLFSYLGDVYTVNDGNLKTTNIYMFAKNKSFAPEFLSYDVNILDKNNKLVSSPTTDGNFTVEYQIESISPITFSNAKYSTKPNAQNKYPAQVVFAVYERVTNKLVDIRMRDFLLDYNKNNQIGALLRWEEPFNLGPGNYYVKVMTFKGNNFYWPETNNSTETLEVFTHQYKK